MDALRSRARARRSLGLDGYPSFSFVVSRHILCLERRGAPRRRGSSRTRSIPTHHAAQRQPPARSARDKDWAMNTIDYRDDDDELFVESVMSKHPILTLSFASSEEPQNDARIWAESRVQTPIPTAQTQPDNDNRPREAHAQLEGDRISQGRRGKAPTMNKLFLTKALFPTNRI